MKRAFLLITIVVLAAACKPIVVQPPATQILYVDVVSDTISGAGGQGYTTGQGGVLGVPGMTCHTPADGGWTSDTATECQVDVPTGATVTLTGVPDDATSRLSMYGDDCPTGSATCTITMNSIKRIYASFIPVALWLYSPCWPSVGCASATVATSTGQTTTYDFGESAVGCEGCDHIYRMVPGTVAVITVTTLLPDYHVVWDNRCAIVGNSCIVTIGNDGTVLDIGALGPELP